MDLKFEVKARIQKPLAEVFDAVYNPKKLAGYFTTAGASAPLDEGQTVMWEFADFPGPFPVVVQQMVKNERLVFLWDAASPAKDGKPYKTTVEIKFEALEPQNTLVTISEFNWEDSENGYKDSRGNLGGWMHMLTCMKAYVEHGINLRTGMF
ncbi:MAG: SRPBCC domain-containing protein [Bdellovibrionaceae bacterium]|nr:SRPBCC domain-containing protein [Pseudobdellovibrionaceae bacterium]